MFNEFRGNRKKLAESQLTFARLMVKTLKDNGILTDSQIESIVKSSLKQEEWTEEVIDIIFYPSRQWDREWERRRASRARSRQRAYERNQRRYEQARQNNNRWWDDFFRNSRSQSDQYSGVNEAIKFFGFESMPDIESLKRRYRELAMKLHPDKGGSTATFQKFQDHKEVLFRRLGL
jgi:hypothetical protein